MTLLLLVWFILRALRTLYKRKYDQEQSCQFSNLGNATVRVPKWLDHEVSDYKRSINKHLGEQLMQCSSFIVQALGTLFESGINMYCNIFLSITPYNNW